MDTARGPITIRPTREGDATAFRELRLEALKTHPAAFGSDFESNVTLPIEHWQERVEPDPDPSKGIIYVASAGETLVGMTGIYRDQSPKLQHNGNIWGVYVRDGWRGLHIADQLIEACIGWARQRQIRLIRLAVITSNASAIRCYVRCGFTVYGVDPEVIYSGGVYHDELLMVRKL